MAQRLLRVIVPSDDRHRLLEILGDHGEVATSIGPETDGTIAVDVVVAAEGNEPLLDALESAFAPRDGFRIVVLPVAATIPRPEEPEEDEDGGRAGDGAPPGTAKEETDEEPALRISREELYTGVKDLSALDTHHLVMVALSAVVASVGLIRDSSAVVVGAMVIAPLLGPNVGLALATTLADVDLGREAIRTGLAGIVVAFAISIGWGLFAEVDPSGREVTRVTRVSYSEIALALAAGAAGVLSISRGTATALVGVMVAVALLPPLVASGLLLGSGYGPAAAQAFGVVAANVICINFAGVVTFLLQGVGPRTWWEEDRARRATRLALAIWAVLLLALLLAIGEAASG